MTPDTSDYMLTGYIVAFAVIGLYLFSLRLRWRALQREMEALADLKREKE